MKTPNLIFLCYLSRSGSTFLAKKLNQYSDVCVGIEGEFSDGFYKPFKPIENFEQLKNYVDIEYNNRHSKIVYWGINKKVLISKLEKKGYPILFKHFLITALELYFKNENNCSVIVHKAGIYHMYIDQVRKEFGDVKFIFINRDPRAIYNSQKRTLGSESKIPMIQNIEQFIKQYKESHREIRKYIGKKYFLLINYENFILNEKEELNKILKFINSKGELKDNIDYFDKIPQTQKSLHKNLKKNADSSRIVSWKSELSLKENYIIEKYLKKYFYFYGYDFLNLPSIISRQKYYLYYIISIIKYNKNYIILPKMRKRPKIYKCYKSFVNLLRGTNKQC